MNITVWALYSHKEPDARCGTDEFSDGTGNQPRMVQRWHI